MIEYREWSEAFLVRRDFGRPFAEMSSEAGSPDMRLFGVTIDGHPMIVRVGRQEGREVSVVDASDGSVVNTFGVGDWLYKGGFISACIVASAGRMSVVTALDDLVVRQWALPTGTKVHPDFSHSPPGTPGGHVTAMASYQDGGDTVLLVGARNGLVRRIDPASGADVGVALRHESSIDSMCLYKVDGVPHVACGVRDGSVWRWNAISGEQVGSPLLGNRSDVRSILSYTIGGEVFLAGASTSVWRWNAVTGERVDSKIGSAVANYIRMEDVSTGLDVVYGSEQTVLIASDGSYLYRYDVATGEPVGEPWDWDVGDYRIQSLCVVPDVDGRTALFLVDEEAIWRFDAVTGQSWPAP